MAEVAQVADVYSIHGKTKDGIGAPFRAFSSVVVGSDSLEFQVLPFVGARSFNDLGLPFDSLDIIMIGMIMADQNDIRLIGDWPVSDSPAEGSGFIGVGDD